MFGPDFRSPFWVDFDFQPSFLLGLPPSPFFFQLYPPSFFWERLFPLPRFSNFHGFCAFPSSRLDSHRDFEPIGIVHVDFRQFSTRFVPILVGYQLGRKFSKPPGGCRPPDPPL